MNDSLTNLFSSIVVSVKDTPLVKALLLDLEVFKNNDNTYSFPTFLISEDVYMEILEGTLHKRLGISLRAFKNIYFTVSEHLKPGSMFLCKQNLMDFRFINNPLNLDNESIGLYN